MKITLEEKPEQEEIEVLVYYGEMSKEVRQLEETLHAFDYKIKCKDEAKEMWLMASEIYYIESVDKQTFIYGEKRVYRSDLRLYQLEEKLSLAGFVRISKSCIMNISKLKSIRSMINSRLEAMLVNGEQITVTRKYIADIRRKLEER